VTIDSPEARLLLCCARSRRDPEQSARIEALLQERIDWDYLLRIARNHRIMPLLSWQLNAISSESIANGVLDKLRTYSHNNGLRNLYLTGELFRILRTFETHGIAVVPYKGPVLAAYAYGNLALREFDDLDFLVRRQDILRAGELLAAFGYLLGYRLTRAQEAAFIRYADQYFYVRDRDRSVVELHWGFASRALSFLLSTERQWWRFERVSLGGGDVLTFSSEDLLLILCVHGSMHRWERLQWVCDIAELINAHRELDWGRLMEKATAMGCRRALLLGILLANELLGVTIPEKAARGLQADPVAKTLAGQVIEWLFREDADSQGLFEESLFQPFHIKVLERLQDKVRYCARQVTVPSMEEYDSLPLPAYLFPAYRLLRPVRLAGKYVRKSLSS